MKRYRLKYELPTFKEGELFHTDEQGNLWLDKGQGGNHWQEEVMAYHHKTIERFPDILTDWFAEIEDKDPLAKEAFIEYLRANPEQRLMQAVCNFANEKLNQNTSRIMAELRGATTTFDTWNWECDQMMLRKDSSEAKEPGQSKLPPREKFENMKRILRNWIEKNEINFIQTFIHTEPDGRRGVRFFDRTNKGNNSLTFIGWPTIGLKDGATYTPEELLLTGEAGKE